MLYCLSMHMQTVLHTFVLLRLVHACLASEGADETALNKTSNVAETQLSLRGSVPRPQEFLQSNDSVNQCEVGAAVHCPHLGEAQMCAGNQCCPDGSTCPSAEEAFASCEKPKTHDCTDVRHQGSATNPDVPDVGTPQPIVVVVPEPTPSPSPVAVPAPATHHSRRWTPTPDRIGGQMNWCEVGIPPYEWTLRSEHCGHLTVKALSYNLYWWNLFKKHGGRGGSAGHLIANAQRSSSFDFMGFQECEDIERVLRDSGLSDHYGYLVGEHATAIAYNANSWHLIASGGTDVAEDRPKEWYGQRPAHWGRFRRKGDGKIVFFLNHHGALPKNTGGLCGTRATAFNIMKVIAMNAHQQDAIIVVGDFNSDASTKTHGLLAHHLHDIYTGQSFGGVDHIYSSCPHIISRTILGDGGSDHDALEVVLKV